MGFKDAVKGMLFTDDGPPKGGASPAKPAVPAGTATPAVPVSPTAVRATSVVQADKALVEKLRKAVDDATEPTYRNFLTAFATLGGTISDVRQRFQSAFAVLGLQGLTVPGMKAAIKARFDALAIQRKKFADGLELLRSEKIGGREQEIQSLDDEIAKRRADIKAREAEINSITLRQNGIRDSIESDRQDIETRGAKAEAAFAALESELNTEQQNAQQHLPGGTNQ